MRHHFNTVKREQDKSISIYHHVPNTHLKNAQVMLTRNPQQITDPRDTKDQTIAEQMNSSNTLPTQSFDTQHGLS
jgi:hypothetical protein